MSTNPTIFTVPKSCGFTGQVILKGARATL